MTPRDEYILSIRLPTPSAALNSLAADLPAGPRPPCGSGGQPPECAHLFCGKPATDGDCCAVHAELFADIRAEYESLRADFEDGWE